MGQKIAFKYVGGLFLIAIGIYVLIKGISPLGGMLFLIAGMGTFIAAIKYK